MDAGHREPKRQRNQILEQWQRDGTQDNEREPGVTDTAVTWAQLRSSTKRKKKKDNFILPAFQVTNVANILDLCFSLTPPSNPSAKPVISALKTSPEPDHFSPPPQLPPWSRPPVSLA